MESLNSSQNRFIEYFNALKTDIARSYQTASRPSLRLSLFLVIFCVSLYGYIRNAHPDALLSIRIGVPLILVTISLLTYKPKINPWFNRLWSGYSWPTKMTIILFSVLLLLGIGYILFEIGGVWTVGSILPILSLAIFAPTILRHLRDGCLFYLIGLIAAVVPILMLSQTFLSEKNVWWWFAATVFMLIILGSGVYSKLQLVAKANQPLIVPLKPELAPKPVESEEVSLQTSPIIPPSLEKPILLPVASLNDTPAQCNNHPKNDAYLPEQTPPMFTAKIIEGNIRANTSTEFRGRGEPNTTLALWVNGAQIDTIDVYSNGKWRRDIVFRDAGQYHVQVVDIIGSTKKILSNQVVIVVDESRLESEISNRVQSFLKTMASFKPGRLAIQCLVLSGVFIAGGLLGDEPLEVYFDKNPSIIPVTPVPNDTANLPGVQLTFILEKSEGVKLNRTAVEIPIFSSTGELEYKEYAMLHVPFYDEESYITINESRETVTLDIEDKYCVFTRSEFIPANGDTMRKELSDGIPIQAKDNAYVYIYRSTSSKWYLGDSFGKDISLSSVSCDSTGRVISN